MEYGNMEKSVAGLKQGIDSRVESRPAGGVIQFGRPAMGKSGDNKVYAFGVSSKLVLDADLITDNEIEVVVNGVNVIPVTYSISHDTTMTAIVNQINADIEGAEASLDAGDVDNRTIVISIPGKDVTASMTITGGSSQPGVTVTSENNQLVVGVVLRTAKEKAGENQYNKYEAVNVLIEGRVTVEIGEAVKINDPVFILNTGVNKGKFGNSGIALKGAVYSENSNGSLANIVIV